MRKKQPKGFDGPIIGQVGQLKEHFQGSRVVALRVAVGNVLDHWENLPNDISTDPGFEDCNKALLELSRLVNEEARS